MSSCYYDVLRVDRNATLDEIKLSFKRRALQVHPDKGGSKQAFHLVYKALETLADPEARKQYDQGLVSEQSGIRRKKTRRKGCHPAAPMEARPKKPPPSSSKSRARTEPEAAQSKQTKWLLKIRDILTQLPRDMRNDVLTKQFSQKQRLILEKWMVENPLQQTAPKAYPLSMARTEGAPEHEAAGLKRDLHQGDDQSIPLVPGTGVESTMMVPLSVKRQVKSKKKESKKKMRRGQGSILRSFYSDQYRADICFDALHVYTRSTDFQTAVDYLVVLTFVKQKLQDNTDTTVTFEDRLQDTLNSCAREHGIKVGDLDLRFCVFQACRFFIGPRLKVRSPRVRSIEQLGKMRRHLEPFRQYSLNLGAKSLLWQYTPAHLQDAWERHQNALIDAWAVAQADSTKFMQTLRGHYEANSCLRQRHLQRWERQHMGAQDKNEYRPKRLQERSSRRREGRERKQMAMYDKQQHQPRKMRGSAYKKSMANEDPSGHLFTLKVLLAKWERLLKREVQSLEKEHRRVLREHKKDQEERKRLEMQKQKRLREEERLRREAHRKRMKSAGLMDDLRWI